MALFHKFCIIDSCVLSGSQNIPKKKEKRNKSRGWKELWMSPNRAEALKQVLKILFRRTEEQYSCSLPKLLQVFLIRSSWSWKLTLPTPIHMQILRLPDTQSIKEEVSNENPLCRCNTIPVLAGEARTGEGGLWGWGGSGEEKGTHRREKGIKKRRVREKERERLEASCSDQWCVNRHVPNPPSNPVKTGGHVTTWLRAPKWWLVERVATVTARYPGDWIWGL